MKRTVIWRQLIEEVDRVVMAATTAGFSQSEIASLLDRGQKRMARATLSAEADPGRPESYESWLVRKYLAERPERARKTGKLWSGI